MSEKEFLIKFNSEYITNDYNKVFLDDLFKKIEVFCDADSVEYRFKDISNINAEGVFEKDKIVYANRNDCYLILRNIKYCFEDEEFFWSMIKGCLINMMNVYNLYTFLKEESKIDKMLNVYNRTAYEDKIKENSKCNLGVIFIDVNGLGVVNNSLGYTQGDELLKKVARIIKEEFRMNDIYRIGGDEFVVICENIPRQNFKNKVERLRFNEDELEYLVSYGDLYLEKTEDLAGVVKIASDLMKNKKEIYRQMHPEKYKNKYEVVRERHSR